VERGGKRRGGMIWEAKRIGEKVQSAGLGIKEAMAVIHMMLGDHHEGRDPVPLGMFEGLQSLMERTLRGARIETFKPQGGDSPFHIFEVHTEDGKVLGHLNMVYMRKPLPCYYLVYVEVMPPFRGKGLGTRILESYKAFLDEKGCLGLLDNIIPPTDPTFHIYTKLGYKPIEEIVGLQPSLRDNNYMVWVPPTMRSANLKDKLLKLVFNLQRKRPIIDMKDNEKMVKTTIEEFREVYGALERMFQKELDQDKDAPLMRFMFTKFATKFLGFRRRLRRLLGYTGGESLEQIRISRKVQELKVQPWSLWGSPEAGLEVLDPAQAEIPRELLEDPTGFIEGLPIYRRPYLSKGRWEDALLHPESLSIGDLLELGFDPTRLREWEHEGKRFVFERSWSRFHSLILERARLLKELEKEISKLSFRGARVSVNPPLALVSHLGNLYIQRRKIEGIHLEEALDQLRSSEYLAAMNEMAKMDRELVSVEREVREWLSRRVPGWMKGEVDELAIFVPWDLERNFPQVMVEPARVSIERVWLA
jgi:GNAT superfamily N-acetyltransferase